MSSELFTEGTVIASEDSGPASEGSEPLLKIGTETVEFDPDKYEWMSVKEAVFRENVSEKSIYNRIRSGFYKSQKLKGQTLVGVLKKTRPSSEATFSTGPEPTEVIQNPSEGLSEPSERGSEPLPNHTSDLIHFMTHTLDRVDSYNRRIVDLEKQNLEARLLTDGRDRTLRDLETQLQEAQARVFEREARIKELEAKLAALETKPKKNWLW